MESDDLLFPIEEVVDNASVENINSESGNMANHAIYVHPLLNTAITKNLHMVQPYTCTLTRVTKVTMER